ncbi:TatD family hydrolase [Desulfuribacillus alkaliarsenatis]|uniref:Hydrolase TatD n=1 Tax=Desulfuribacillus alkaliarsenatis TaxID=766136 RepID=A0A1E5FYT6_9FIRM|nr:TatD family hydrolase [Desulfuribacillus alkaliarsenatis]OEF95745.1 hydrolase TatD [Desulfuribacillus alkaliarsenatis]
MLIDTHAHLDDKRFQADFEEVCQRIKTEKVAKVINVGYNLQSSERSLELAKTYDWIQCAVGYHPHDAKLADEAGYEQLRLWSGDPEVVAIGEIGLDYYYDNSPRDVQLKVFRKQIHIAKEVGLPIIIHNRDAHQDVYDALREEGAKDVGGIMHCYSGSYEMAQRFIELNFFISLAGPVTFKNAKNVKDVGRNIPLEYLLIETDSPYLTPEPHRGKRNEPANVRYVAETIAELREMEYKALARATSDNALKALPKLRL